MKMIAFLCGEISNAAKYFSSFANVSSDNVNNLKGTFGNDENSTLEGSLGIMTAEKNCQVC